MKKYSIIAFSSLLLFGLFLLFGFAAKASAQTAPNCYDSNVNLRIGDSSKSYIAALQKILPLEGFNISSDEKTKVLFGESTASAVSGFQQKYKDEILTPLGLLYPTGYFGPATRAKLNRLYGCKFLVSVAASTPATSTIVRGTNNVNFADFRFDAAANDIRVNSIIINRYGTASGAEIGRVALYDGNTIISDLKEFSTTGMATFNNLNLIIPKKSSKIISVKGVVDSNTTIGDTVSLGINSASNISAVNIINNTTTSIIGFFPIKGNVFSIIGGGDVFAFKALDDADSQAGIITAGTEAVLAKINFGASYEDMEINKFQILVNNLNNAFATTSLAADEVTVIKLYDGITQIGYFGGYPVTGSGDNSGVVFITGLNWVIPKNTSKILTIKGVVNTIAGGADSGGSVYAHLMNSGFEAAGSTMLDTSINSVSGNQKIIYKSNPIITIPVQPSYRLSPGIVPVFRFTVSASSLGQISWKKVQFAVLPSGVDIAASSSMYSSSLRDIQIGNYLNMSAIYSGTNTSNSGINIIRSGETGYITLVLNAEQIIPAGSSKTYELNLPLANISYSASSLEIKLNKHENLADAGKNYNIIEGVSQDGEPSFIWSDDSAINYSVLTNDWANGVYVSGLPSSPVIILVVNQSSQTANVLDSARQILINTLNFLKNR